jgi:hypothetical protein
MTLDEAREWWEERAAIMEYDGEVSRETAEVLAMDELAKRVGASLARRAARYEMGKRRAV